MEGALARLDGRALALRHQDYVQQERAEGLERLARWSRRKANRHGVSLALKDVRCE